MAGSFINSDRLVWPMVFEFAQHQHIELLIPVLRKKNMAPQVICILFLILCL